MVATRVNGHPRTAISSHSNDRETSSVSERTVSDLKTDAELRAGSGAGTWSPGSSRCGAAWGCLGEARRVLGSVRATVRRGCCGPLRCCASCWIYSCQVTIATGAHLHFLFDLSNRASTCPAPCCHSRFLSIFLLQIPLYLAWQAPPSHSSRGPPPLGNVIGWLRLFFPNPPLLISSLFKP